MQLSPLNAWIPEMKQKKTFPLEWFYLVVEFLCPNSQNFSRSSQKFPSRLVQIFSWLFDSGFELQFDQGWFQWDTLGMYLQVRAKKSPSGTYDTNRGLWLFSKISQSWSYPQVALCLGILKSPSSIDLDISSPVNWSIYYRILSVFALSVKR